jgi:hypothetical protein
MLEVFLQLDAADSVAGIIHFPLQCGRLLKLNVAYVPAFAAALHSVPPLIKDGIDVSFRSRSRTAYIRSEEFPE